MAWYPKLDARFRSRYGPAAVVTGASEGIGRAAALHLAEAGFDLVVAARRRPALMELAAHVQSTYRVRCDVFAADLAAPGACRDLADAARARDVGLLVAAAGFGTSGPLVASVLDEEVAMVDVNCRAVLELCHRFGGRFAARGRGGIVLMSSLLAFQGVPRAANYAATKAYVQALAEGLRLELEPRGVDVLAAAPGPVASGFARRAGMVMARALPPGPVALATLAALGRRGTVRPGWLSRALALSLAPLPRAGRVRILGRVMAGMTAHHPAVPCHDSPPHGHEANAAPGDEHGAPRSA